MTSRERVFRCIEFDHPDRAPRELWWIPIAQIEHGQARLDAFRKHWPSDFDTPFIEQKGLRSLIKGDAYALGTFQDAWGCVFENVQAGVHGEVKHPILDDWSKLEDFRPPYALLDLDIEGINAQARKLDTFRLSACTPRPFERLQFLRGTENLMMDLLEDSAEMHELLRIVHEFFVREAELFATKLEIDALFFMDDWGSQRALLIDPKIWRKVFKPLYAEYVKIAHDNGKKAFMHSDGHIEAIYPDLIEIGVDAINSQLFCMDIEEIGRRFKGKITFWGEIDRQHVLPYGTPDEARAAVGRVVKNLWSPEGGVIAQFELTAGSKMANAEAIFETFDQLTTVKR